MAEEQFGTRRDTLKDLAPWTKLFTAFKIALDPKKLVLAGAGLLVMSLGWWVLSAVFFSMNADRPMWDSKQYPDSASTDKVKRDEAWKEFKRDRHRWYLTYQMAGTPTMVESSDEVAGKKIQVPKERKDVADLANSPEEYDELTRNPALAKYKGDFKPYGRFKTLPWFEYRGPNPVLLVADATEGPEVHASATPAGKSEGPGFLTWLRQDQAPVLLEPLFKFFEPIRFMFDAQAGFWNRVYLILIIVWSLATWAFFGGAITRIAAVQVARSNERISLKDAVKFVWIRYKAYLTAPIFPLLFLAALTFVLFFFGILEANTYAVGDILGPLFWPLVLLVGLIMAVVLVGLVGWPLMYTTISAEGSDSFDAISRSYSYVYQAPWHYLWYAFVAVVYGAVLVFFVGFMGSLVVYTSKWAVSLAPSADSREPTYLFRWAPTSFGWRDLLLHKSTHAELREVVNTRGHRQMVAEAKVDSGSYESNAHNNIGAFIVSVWLYLFFLVIVGFGYSYFWTASTIIYLLMRQKVDDTELDEIHLEEEPEQPFPPPGMPPPGGTEPPKPAPSPLNMVEPPQMRMPAPTPAAPSQPTPNEPPPRTDGPTPGGMM
ncbi:MAG TPA: hypothetical protein VE988_05600 [Gemmataceae bacterium]|nr:hypothetical protein [Gemmataceae bacterium]